MKHCVKCHKWYDNFWHFPHKRPCDVISQQKWHGLNCSTQALAILHSAFRYMPMSSFRLVMLARCASWHYLSLAQIPKGPRCSRPSPSLVLRSIHSLWPPSPHPTHASVHVNKEVRRQLCLRAKRRVRGDSQCIAHLNVPLPLPLREAELDGGYWLVCI